MLVTATFHDTGLLCVDLASSQLELLPDDFEAPSGSIDSWYEHASCAEPARSRRRVLVGTAGVVELTCPHLCSCSFWPLWDRSTLLTLDTAVRIHDTAHTSHIPPACTFERDRWMVAWLSS